MPIESLIVDKSGGHTSQEHNCSQLQTWWSQLAIVVHSKHNMILVLPSLIIHPCRALWLQLLKQLLIGWRNIQRNTHAVVINPNTLWMYNLTVVYFALVWFLPLACLPYLSRDLKKHIEIVLNPSSDNTGVIVWIHNKSNIGKCTLLGVLSTTSLKMHFRQSSV